MKRVMAMLFVAAPLFAQSVAVTSHTVVVAHDGVIDTYDPKTLERTGRTDGVEYAGAIVVDGDEAVVLDPLHNRARFVDGPQLTTRETPIEGAFVNHELFILERDARTLSHEGASVKTGADPRFVRVANGKLYVYSSVSGLLQEITPSPLTIARELPVSRFATDFETDGTAGFLTDPHEGAVHMIDLEKMTVIGTVRIGNVPFDLEFAGEATALTARVIAVADPGAKRVWRYEGGQSPLAAFSRGFLRGVIGLGQFGKRDAGFPTRVDRVVSRGSQWLAFDSFTGTLYSVTKKKADVIASGLAPRAFALGDGVVYLWQNGTLVAQKTNG